MKISVAICTWNRARLLDLTLESISNLKIPPKIDWELIVVDNNSTEPAAPFVLEDWRKKLPLKIFIEKEQGHSSARNCAVKHSSGDYIIWTDNDVLVSENWLAEYAQAFTEGLVLGSYEFSDYKSKKDENVKPGDKKKIGFLKKNGYNMAQHVYCFLN